MDGPSNKRPVARARRPRLTRALFVAARFGSRSASRPVAMRRTSQPAPLSILALLAVLAGAGCGRGPVAPAHVRVNNLRVVLVILDAAGARYLGAYGNPLPTSPNVDALTRS